MRLLTAFCIAVLAVAIATPAFAAVQNIKVSGEVGARAIVNHDLDLKRTSLDSTSITSGITGTGASKNADSDEFVLSTVKVGIDSDLTDNVSASLTLANQTRWGDGGTAGAGDIVLNKAYLTLKEFFYSPLTIKVGRQPLLFGQGFVVGPGLFNDPTAAFPQPLQNEWDPFAAANAGAIVPFSGPQGREYSISQNFDAVRATLDFDPWTVDGIWALINETDTAHDDENLLGVNVGYKFDVYNAKVEGYYFYDRDESFNSTLGLVRQVNITAGNTALDNTVPGVGSRVYEENEVHVLGLRGDIEPLENLTLSGEGAYQFGSLIDDTGPWNSSTNGSPLERDRSAWAVDVEGDYIWNEVAYKPNLGLGYVFLSGEEEGNSGDFEAWDPMFKGKFFSKIRDYQYGDQVDRSFFGGAMYSTRDENDTAGNTNSHILFVDGGLKPLEDLTLKARYLHFWFAEKPIAGRNRNIGDEVDASLTYDYTEDVQFDLTGAWFIPGKYYDGATELSTNGHDQRGNDLATSVTGSVRVAF